MQTIAIPITLLISLATFFITVGGVWFVTQKRVRDLEFKASGHDKKHERIITEMSSLKIEVNAEINNLKTEVNAEISSLKAEVSGLKAEVNTEISGLKTEINGVKVEIARLQGSIMTLNEKFDLFIQGRLIPATPLTQVP